MIPSFRKAYNQSFTKEAYKAFLDELNSLHPGAIDFRVAETPIFIDKILKEQMLDTCAYIIQHIQSPSYKTEVANAIPSGENFPNQNRIPHCLVFDFGICTNDKNELYPALIELQGFPSLYAFQGVYPSILEKHFNIPNGFSSFFNGLNQESYLQTLKKFLLGSHHPEEVILLEIKPHQQKTRIDFYLTESFFGIKPICVTEVKLEDRKPYYLSNGEKKYIKRIYNRVILDEWKQEKDMAGSLIDFQGEMDVEWLAHPNWFYQISKYLLPFLHHPFIPSTKFLSEVPAIPTDLENYVLKPLFSFAGQGVIIDVQSSDIENIKDPVNWILQRKVNYADCIETPDGFAKAEIRLMYIWNEEEKDPILITNLARLSKGKMIGTRYNKDKEWVGGTVAYFEK
jgi:hypothetical protein